MDEKSADEVGPKGQIKRKQAVEEKKRGDDAEEDVDGFGGVEKLNSAVFRDGEDIASEEDGIHAETEDSQDNDLTDDATREKEVKAADGD